MQVLNNIIFLVSLLRLCHATRMPFSRARSPLRPPLPPSRSSSRRPGTTSGPRRALGDEAPNCYSRREIEFGALHYGAVPSGGFQPRCWGELLHLRGGGGSSSSMQLNIKTMSGRTITVEVEPDEAIESLKAKIAAQEGVPAEQQRLVFGSKQLDGRRSVADYGLGDQSTISLVLRLRGGGGSRDVDCVDDHAALWIIRLLGA